MRQSTGQTEYARLMKALAHPLRERILAALVSREASPSQLARRLGEPLPNVNGHIKQLERLGVVELVETRTKRGAVEHVYRALMRPWFHDDVWAELGQGQREALTLAVLNEVFADIDAAIRGKTFDAQLDRHLSRMTLVLDREGWTKLQNVLSDVLQQAHAILAESLERQAADPNAEVIRARLALLLFQAAHE